MGYQEESTGGGGPLERRFWGVIVEEVARFDLGMDGEAQEGVRELIHGGVERLERDRADEAKVEGAEKKLRLVGQGLAAGAIAERTRTITRRILDDVKRTFCPLYPFC